MPQNTKDSKGGKNQSVKDTAANGGKRSEKGAADSKPNSPVGSQNKGEKRQRHKNGLMQLPCEKSDDFPCNASWTIEFYDRQWPGRVG